MKQSKFLWHVLLGYTASCMPMYWLALASYLSKKSHGQQTYRLLLYYAHVRPCTPMYAQYAHKLHPVRPVRPWAYMGVHCTPIKNLYAHIIVRPWAYMGVHVRPQKKFQQFFVGVQCTPMYAHVRPCTPTRNFVWAYNVRPQKNTYAHKNGYCLRYIDYYAQTVWH